MISFSNLEVFTLDTSLVIPILQLIVIIPLFPKNCRPNCNFWISTNRKSVTSTCLYTRHNHCWGTSGSFLTAYENTLVLTTLRIHFRQCLFFCFWDKNKIVNKMENRNEMENVSFSICLWLAMSLRVQLGSLMDH